MIERVETTYLVYACLIFSRTSSSFSVLQLVHYVFNGSLGFEGL